MTALPKATADCLPAPGLVSLVGAGPGDPELLTYRAIRRLECADVVFHDGLVPAAITLLATTAERVSVSRRAGQKGMTLSAVTRLMIQAARRGQRVVRLKSGDPFVFGRGGEEALALAAARVSFEVVPGLTTAVAAPALAGIPVTHRGIASGFVVVSGHAPSAYMPILGALAPGFTTVVVLMGMRERAGLSAFLTAQGWRTDTAAAVIARASQPTQRVWTGTLEMLSGALRGARADTAGVIVIGEVVSLRPLISALTPGYPGFSPRAAASRRVTRSTASLL